MDFRNIVLQGFFNYRTDLKEYFIAEQKRAEKENYFNKNIFFNGCLKITDVFENNIKQQLQDRKRELSLIVSKYKSDNDLINYTNTKLELNNLNINNFYYQITEYNFNMSYDEILYIKNSINNANNIQDNNIPKLKTNLTEGQIKLLYNELIKESYINKNTKESNFLTAFGYSNNINFEPIEWIQAKNSLRWLLELIIKQKTDKDYIPNNTRNEIITKLFKDKKGISINVGKPDNRENDVHLNVFKTILRKIK